MYCTWTDLLPHASEKHTEASVGTLCGPPRRSAHLMRQHRRRPSYAHVSPAPPSLGPRLAQEGNWAEKHRIFLGTGELLPGDYSQHLARAKFCLVAPGASHADGRPHPVPVPIRPLPLLPLETCWSPPMPYCPCIR